MAPEKPKDKKHSSISRVMYIFVVLTVLAAALGTAILSYFVSVNQIDNYFKRLAKNSAENFAELVDADYLLKLRNAAESGEFQALRDQAEEDEDELPVENYLKEHGLWEEYSETRERLHIYLGHMEDVNYPHLRSLRSLRSGGLSLSGSENDFF